MIKLCKTFAMAACVALLAMSAAPAMAKMRKEYIELTVPAGETASNAVVLDYPGTIKLARIDTPATCTLTLTAYNGSAADLSLATATVSSTGVSSVSGFASVPVAGEVRVSATVGSSSGSARTIRLVVLTEE